MYEYRIEIARVAMAAKRSKTYLHFCGLYDTETPAKAGQWLKSTPLFNKLKDLVGYYEGKPGNCMNREHLLLLRHPDTNTKCSVCERDIKLVVPNGSKTCSYSCGFEASKESRAATMLEMYGAVNPSHSKKLQKRRTKTFRKKYGVDNPFQAEEVKKKIKKTMLEKYGVENPSYCEDVKAKRVQTFLARYGEVHWTKNSEKFALDGRPFTAEDIAKAKATCLRIYGCENPWGSKEVQAKCAKTNMDRYGVANAGVLPNYTFKKVTDIFGKVHKVQGYEGRAILSIGKSKGVTRIDSGFDNVPTVKYKNSAGKYSVYYPDIIAYTKNSHTIFEVKSEWTLAYGWENNLCKFRAATKFCKKRGGSFKVVVYWGNKRYVIKNPVSYECFQAAGLPEFRHPPVA